MNRGNKHPSAGFKKGDKNINRKGPPLLPKILKQIRELERTELTEQFSEQLRMSKAQLKVIIEDPDTVFCTH